ncbi:hypothetical protein FTUN_5676 [Frigoriglobus tundricola]|uniref:Uncharacterized protein n=1 Tax=Frigoriglobus tundricola TaxID=2774151 RepID=A0A6M5YXJ1_9BACT|nr:hypothetical protein FTUN_5676 [Frigoriglobus tundricola]
MGGREDQSVPDSQKDVFFTTGGTGRRLAPLDPLENSGG